MEGGVSIESQDSEIVRMSRLLSVTNSWRAAGLSRSAEIVVADRTLRWEMLRNCGEVGPGLTSMSPESKSRIEISNEAWFGGRKPCDTIERLIRKQAGKESRALDIEAKGKGW